MSVRSLVALSLIAVPAAASASSDAAWRAFHAQVAARCEAASALVRPHSAPVVGFDDTLGKVVTLVTGTTRPVRGRATTISMLCVYDQRTKRVWVSEAAGWRAPAR